MGFPQGVLMADLKLSVDVLDAISGSLRAASVGLASPPGLGTPDFGAAVVSDAHESTRGACLAATEATSVGISGLATSVVRAGEAFDHVDTSLAEEAG